MVSRSGSLVVLLACLAATCEVGRESLPPGERPSRSPSAIGSTSESAGSTLGSSSDDEAGDAGNSSSGSTQGDGEPELPTFEVLTLAYGPDPAQTLDLYLHTPAPAEPIAVVVLAHGGLWQGGDKLALANLCEALVESRTAMACASINYRLSHALGGVCRGAGVDTYVEQVRDFAQAYALLHERAALHHFDPARFYVGGHSAGAHLAHVLELRWSDFKSACARLGGCPAPAGAIGIEGIYDVAAWDAYDAQAWNGAFACATRKAFGAPPNSPTPCLDGPNNLPCWQIGSPTYLAQHAVALGLAPLGHALLVHSPDDDWVDIAEASSFAGTRAAAFPGLHAWSSTDGGCGSGSHDAVLGDPKLATCISNFVASGGTSH